MVYRLIRVRRLVAILTQLHLDDGSVLGHDAPVMLANVWAESAEHLRHTSYQHQALLANERLDVLCATKVRGRGRDDVHLSPAGELGAYQCSEEAVWRDAIG
ncbi:hypothetical protein PR048_012995 [Dryococelus australis]|uniref:Uncharacterized protein n=1 Tax=Dryococelus australis TaxID=614101 RepID=A0ABQ9HQX7_9NEOP|nr:hypothetical protein PR048_012995 [Dryococelus australis]